MKSKARHAFSVVEGGLGIHGQDRTAELIQYAIGDSASTLSVESGRMQHRIIHDPMLRSDISGLRCADVRDEWGLDSVCTSRQLPSVVRISFELILREKPAVAPDPIVCEPL
jgi:hypothetical protein